MIPANELAKDIPLTTVGSSTFGRYPKISAARTFNMIMSDEWLVDYAGYFNVLGQNSETKLPNPINANGVGRGAYHSTKLNRVVVCVYNGVYLITDSITVSQIGTVNTFNGDVFIAEDTQGHIAVCDKLDIWIYTEATGVFTKATLNGTLPLDFIPGYVSYQNGRFISVDLSKSQWRLSDPATGNMQFPGNGQSNGIQFVGGFQTKPDNPVAALPLPGKGNNLLVMGSIVTEFWVDQGLALFPYQKSTGVNLDYGTLNADTIAVSKDLVCWLAGNEKSGPFIAYSTGGVPEQISTDGIDFLLGNLSTPSDSHGFFFRQDGHLIYQLTFPTDNISLIYDFNTKKFFDVSDENFNYHPAKRTVYFNDTYYFVSLNDGNFYEFDTSTTTYNYGYNEKQQYIEKEIPRVRICDTIRTPTGALAVFNSISVPFEMGTQPDPGMSIARIDLTDIGSGYTVASAYLKGGGGQGATASVSINTGEFALMNGQDFALMDGQQFDFMVQGQILGVNVIDPGANYSYAPEVIITGDGTGAGATAILTINTLPRADLSVSYNGAMTFTNDVGIQFNTEGHYKNRFTYYGLGSSNECTVQLKLWSKGRFVMGMGSLSAYQ